VSAYYKDEQIELILGDALEVLRELPDESVDCVVTSPPYFGLRSYEADGQYGLEATVAEYISTLRAVFTEAKRVLAKDGTCFINIDDSYSAGGQGGNRGGNLTGGEHDHVAGPTRVPGYAPKNLLLVPERLLIALQDDGWTVRNKAIWHVTNSMPESVTDRFAHRYEHVFMLSRSPRYWFDLDAVREPHRAPERRAGASAFRARNASLQRTKTGAYTGPDDRGRNPGDIWAFGTRAYREAHFATFPLELPAMCIKAGCKPGGTVLDPFSGSGTTGEAARMLGRKYVGVDLSAAYHDLAVKRFAQGVLDFDEVAS
jgi:DNA modification methylase